MVAASGSMGDPGIVALKGLHERLGDAVAFRRAGRGEGEPQAEGGGHSRVSLAR